jgi:hypothetical protein
VKAFLTVLLVSPALALAACGGGGSTSTVTTTTAAGASASLSKSDYIKQADAICADYQARAHPLDQKANSELQSGDYQAAAQTFQQELDLAREEVQKVRALSEPEADQATLDKMFAKLDEGYGIVQRAADSLKQDDVQSFVKIGQTGVQPASEAKGIAQAYGFQACSSD